MERAVSSVAVAIKSSSDIWPLLVKNRSFRNVFEKYSLPVDFGGERAKKGSANERWIRDRNTWLALFELTNHTMASSILFHVLIC